MMNLPKSRLRLTSPRLRTHNVVTPKKRKSVRRGPGKRKSFSRPVPGAIDPRSHFTKDGRTILYGKDMEMLRLRVFFRCNGYCEAKSHASACSIWVGIDDGELDHIRPRKMGGGFRDDTEENTQWLSRPCHLEKTSGNDQKARAL